MPEQNEKDHGQTYFEWSFDEWAHFQRGQGWYTIAFVVAVVLLVYCFFARNVLFGIFIVLTGLVVALFEQRKSRVNVAVTEDGIVVNDRLYSYKDEIKNFYIIYQPPETKMLYVELKKFLSPRLPLWLEDQNPVKIREALLQHIPEDLDHEHEPLSDQFSRMFKL